MWIKNTAVRNAKICGSYDDDENKETSISNNYELSQLENKGWIEALKIDEKYRAVCQVSLFGLEVISK